MQLIHLWATLALAATSTRSKPHIGTKNVTPETHLANQSKTATTVNITQDANATDSQKVKLYLSDKTAQNLAKSADQPFPNPPAPHDSQNRQLNYTIDKLVSQMTEIGKLIPRDCYSFDGRLSLWKMLKKDLPPQRSDMMKEQYLEAMSSLSEAVDKMLNCKYSPADKERFPTLRIPIFDLLASNIILTGLLYDMSPYHSLPSYHRAEPANLLRKLIDRSDIDVGDFEWNTIWRGRPI